MKMFLDIEGQGVINEHNNDYCCSKLKKLFESKYYDFRYEKQFCCTSCKRRDGGVFFELNYCPFCGKNIKNKNDIYERILRRDFGVQDPYDNDDPNIPLEFKTDEWWKKRGL